MNYHMTKSINIECETGRLLYVTHDIIRITHVLTCTLGCKIFRIFSERIYNNDLNNKRIKKMNNCITAYGKSQDQVFLCNYVLFRHLFTNLII